MCVCVWLLTWSVEHDQDRRVFGQEPIEGVVSQVKDRGVSLRPLDLWDLRLGGLGTGETGEGGSEKRMI